MNLRMLVPLLFVLGACRALDFTNYLPGGDLCGLNYGSVIKKHSWVCQDSQFQTYPGDKVRTLLQDSAYWEARDYLNVTKDCRQYHDHDQIWGENEYYTYESICKMNRRPIRVIWAQVPGYTVPMNLMGLNSGLLPVHVLEGQSLYDVECVHPWADGVPKHIPPRMARRLERITFDGVKRHLCLAGYAYNYNLMCKPTGYIQREVLVYSEHANKIFSVVIPDVPTSCACAYCECHKKGPVPFPV